MCSSSSYQKGSYEHAWERFSLLKRRNRFDPVPRQKLVKDKRLEKPGYEHPVSTTTEYHGKESVKHVRLPGIQALFDAADGAYRSMVTLEDDCGRHPPCLTTSASIPVYPSPYFLSLASSPPSSSPSVAQTLHYSSRASHQTFTSDQYGRQRLSGWSAPHPDRASSSSADVSSPKHASKLRFLSDHSTAGEHTYKQRRFDSLPTWFAREPAKERWQAQKRKAYSPKMSPLSYIPDSGSMRAQRSLLHPQTAAPAMSAHYLSEERNFTPRFGHVIELPPRQAPFQRSSVGSQPSERGTIVDCELVHPSAGLTAAKGRGRQIVQSHTEMQSPPIVHDRRLDPIPAAAVSSRRSSSQSLPFVIVPPPHESTPAICEKPRVHKPVQSLGARPLITGWPTPREFTDNAIPSSALNITFDSGQGGQSPRSLRDKRRPAQPPSTLREETDIEMNGEDATHSLKIVAQTEAGRVEAASDQGDLDESSPGAMIIRCGPDVRPEYACAYCAKRFARPSSLRIHIYSREYIFRPSRYCAHDGYG